jgi:hypothetical protein
VSRTPPLGLPLAPVGGYFVLAGVMKGNRIMKNWQKRKFKNHKELMTFLKEQEQESQNIKKLHQRRPLRKDDQLFRSTTVLDGKAYWYSIVHRADGSIEFWMKRYVDDDDSICDTTHETFTLVTTLTRVDG